MPVSVPVHDGLDGDFLLRDFDEAQSIGFVAYLTTPRTKIKNGRILSLRTGRVPPRCRRPIPPMPLPLASRPCAES
jgi:hypothetical protein